MQKSFPPLQVSKQKLVAKDIPVIDRLNSQTRPAWPSMDLHNDKHLAERMSTGDQRAFDEFFHGYFDRLYRFALVRMNHDVNAAEDVVQQTMCRAVEKISLYRGESALFTWLCKICRNTIVDSFRATDRPRGQVIPFEETDEIRLALESLSSISCDDPEQNAINQQLTRLVRVVLDYLPRSYGQVLEWKYIEGHSVKEIAGYLGVGPKAAESTLTRARKAFKEGFAALQFGEALATSLGER
jgi:RNA polymerase sigma-70 factor (ECF subfamily)